ncbi:hypothetical protein EJ04DRAFT_506033 [Polyplosphaeria fusca]|uniref:Methyltransferase n=1 Tax=Polyplosphaeria fusca TaxID=682080 RepID=A0A9P4QKN7_9PLEO|nr:hypothetical protein EJ04DRAFT_506033 [Polyplosphaeria fusca]
MTITNEFPSGSDVQTAEVLYLKRDGIHAHEKPYKLRYDPGEGNPRSNCTNETRTIEIRNLRGVEGMVTMEDDGFMWLPLQSSLAYDDFWDPARVREVYYNEIRQLLFETLRPSHIEILEHQTRKRHEQFPIFTGEVYKHLQPTTIVHIDFTLETALRISREFFHVPEGKYQRMQCINIWRPLRGPVSDWPLALSDRKTVDHESETMGVDIVTREGFSENAQLYYNPKHTWYYLSDQKSTEATLFCQIDTDMGHRAEGVAHTGFQHANATNSSLPRESVEVRAFVYY